MSLVDEDRVARRELLDRYFLIGNALDGLAGLDSDDADPERASLLDLERTCMTLRHRIIDEYRVGLTPVAVSRCPFTEALVEVPLDVSGLDGLWWDHGGPVRPTWTRPATLIGLTGAVALGESPRSVPFLCRPGPGVPYVLPRMLEPAGVTAVVSSLQVGPNRAFVTAYFAEAWPDGLEPPNDWGAAESVVWGERPGWTTCALDEGTEDFELGPWVSSKRILWIAPGDTTLRIRSGRRGCSYVGVDGVRRFQRIEMGRVW